MHEKKSSAISPTAGFHHFSPGLEESNFVLLGYSCALVGDILLQGHLYITENYFAFYSNVFGYVTKVRLYALWHTSACVRQIGPGGRLISG